MNIKEFTDGVLKENPEVYGKCRLAMYFNPAAAVQRIEDAVTEIEFSSGDEGKKQERALRNLGFAFDGIIETGVFGGMDACEPDYLRMGFSSLTAKGISPTIKLAEGVEYPLTLFCQFAQHYQQGYCG